MADGDVSLRYRLLGSDESASRAFDKVGRSSDHLHTKMLAVGTALGGLAASGAVALGGLAISAVKTGLETASAMQQASIGFTTLLGSAKKADDFITQMKEFAKATPFEFSGLVDSSRLLLGVGVASKDVIPMLTAFGDAAGALSIKQDAFQRIMLATSQAISAGRFNVGDLNQIMTNGLPVWTLLSHAMHKSVPELRDLASHGKLLSTDVLPLLQKEMEKTSVYGGAMAAQSKTLAGLWATMQDTFAQGMAEVLTPLVPLMQAVLPGAMTALGNALTGLADSVKSSVGIFQQIGPSLHKAFGDPKTTTDINTLRATVSKAFQEIWAAVGPSLRQIWQTIQTQVVPAFQAFVKAMIPVVNFLVKTLTPTVKAAMQAILSIINGALQVISGILNAWAAIMTGNWSKLWASIRQTLSGAAKVIVGLVRTLVAAIVGAFRLIVPKMTEIGRDAMTGLGQGIKDNAPAVLNPAGWIGGQIGEKIRSALDSHSPSRVMIKIGRDVIAGLAVGLKQEAPTVYSFLESFAKRIGSFKVTAGMRNDVQLMANTFAPGLRNVGAQLDVLTEKIKNQQQAYDELVKTRDDYAKQLSQGINGGGSIAGIGLAKDEVDSDGNVTKKADVVGEFVKSLQAKSDAITKFGDNVNNLRAEGLSDAVIQQIQQAGLETGGALASALATATPEAVKSINALSDHVTAESNKMGKQWADDMYKSGVDAAKGLLEGLKSQESHLMWAIRTIAQNMVDEIKKTLKIKSPSGVMADEVGAMIPAGLVAGIQAGAGGVASAMSSLVRIPSVGTRVPLGASIAGTGAGAGVTNIHLHVPNGFVGSPDQLATALSDVISRAKARGLNLSFA